MFKLLLQLSLFACWCCPSLISERIDKIPRSNADFPGFGRFIRISGLATKFLFSSLVFLFLSLASLPRISFVKVKFYYVAVPCWEFGCSGKLMWTVQLIQSPKLSCLFSSFFFCFFQYPKRRYSAKTNRVNAEVGFSNCISFISFVNELFQRNRVHISPLVKLIWTANVDWLVYQTTTFSNLDFWDFDSFYRVNGRMGSATEPPGGFQGCITRPVLRSINLDGILKTSLRIATECKPITRAMRLFFSNI